MSFVNLALALVPRGFEPCRWQKVAVRVAEVEGQVPPLKGPSLLGWRALVAEVALIFWFAVETAITEHFTALPCAVRAD